MDCTAGASVHLFCVTALQHYSTIGRELKRYFHCDSTEGFFISFGFCTPSKHHIQLSDCKHCYSKETTMKSTNKLSPRSSFLQHSCCSCPTFWKTYMLTFKTSKEVLKKYTTAQQL